MKRLHLFSFGADLSWHLMPEFVYSELRRKDQTNQCLLLGNSNVFIKHGWMSSDLVQLGNLLKGYSSLSSPLGIQTANLITFQTRDLSRRAVSQMHFIP